MGILPKLATLMVVVTLSSSSVVHSPVSTDGVFELLILHNNDMHARFEQTSQLSGTCTTADRELGKCYGGFPRVAHVVKEARKAAASGEGPPVLYLNAGDTYTGTAWFTIYKWKIAAEFLNALQPDAVSLGNSDLNRDADGLSPLLNNIETPVLAANIMLNNKKSNNNLHKSVIFDVKGTKVGLVGYLTPIADALDSAGDIEYINEVIALREEVENLKTQNVNIIIALGQSNTDTDIEIAREVDGIDLVISGHKNSYYWSGQNKEIESPNQIIVVQKSGKQVPVLQSTPYDKYLGKLMVKFDNNGEIIDFNNAPVLMDESVPQDLQAIEVVTKNKEELAKSATEELGKTAVVLDGDSCKTEECNFGNLVTDAIMYSYAIKYEGDNWTDAPIAVVHSGAISGSIAPNNRPASITRSDLIKALPVEGNIVAVTMNGAVLKQVLEQSVADLSFERPNGQLLQFSGIRATYDISKEPGSRLVNAVARCSCIVPDFYVIEESRNYKILMPAALADGEFGYTMLKSLPKQEVGTDEVTSVSEYLRLRSPVYPEVASRIVFDGRDNFSEPDSAMHVTSSCLGNHEFDEGVSGLVPFIRNLTSPVLAANLKLEDEPKLMNETNLYKSVVLETGGTRIGVIGYLTPDTAFLSPRNKVKYEDEIVALKREVSDLKKQGIEIIIALGHSGFTKDKEIAEHVDGLDLVIGGHTNTFLWNSDTTNEIPEKVEGRYPVVVIQPNGRKVLVVQAYAYTKYLGRLHLTFDSKGEITKYDGEPILLNQEIPEDPNLLNIVERNREAVGVIYNEVVGKSLVLLNGECRLYECNIGNLITDAMLNYTKQLHPEYDSVNISICQGGRIRTSIDYPTKPFNVTKGSLLDVLPFSDNLSIVKMNGTMLKQALEHSVAMWSTVDKKGQFLQMSGIEVTFDLAKPPGSRVVDMRAICSKCENAMSKVKDYYEYNIIMPFFLAQGGDNFTMFVNLPKETTRYNEFDCVVEYTRNYSPINANVTGRITIVNSESVNNLQLLATNNSASKNIHRAFNTLYLIALIFFKYL